MYGMKINREYFGPLTTALIEPSIPIVINIIQAILSAKQGVRSISLGLAEQGNRSQDIAGLHVLKKVADRYLRKCGFTNVRTTTVFHQYMSAFPENENKAEQLIVESATTAALGGATRVMVKTPVEAFKIPSPEENIRGINCVRRGIEKSKQVVPDRAAIQKEIALLETEVTCMLTAVEALGEGEWSRGAVRALLEGIIDVPFSPNQYNRNELITFRSTAGVIRFAQCNNLPFPEHIREFHYNELADRKIAEGASKLYPILEKDLTRIWKGDYRWWPLDNHYSV
jgi:methylaspartate mutase epsilon subunit